MMPKSRSYEHELMGYLQDSELAVAYLNAALEEGEEELFLVALQNVAKASGKGADWFEQLENVQPRSADRTAHQLFMLLKELRLGLKSMEFPKVV